MWSDRKIKKWYKKVHGCKFEGVIFHSVKELLDWEKAHEHELWMQPNDQAQPQPPGMGLAWNDDVQISWLGQNCKRGGCWLQRFC